MRTVYARDLAAAHGDGLITLTALASPGELEGSTLAGLTHGQGIVESLAQVRGSVARFVALDSPDHLLSRSDSGAAAIDSFSRDLDLGLRLTRLRCVVNLNSADPPQEIGDLAGGPLFPARPAAPTPECLADLADRLLSALCSGEVDANHLRIDWHLAANDFVAAPGPRERLQRIARLALEGAPLAFSFDRPRRAVPLAEAIDRRHPATLLTVGIHLPRLLREPGANDPAILLDKKLPSLVRLALSAGLQKCAYLRKTDAALSKGFLLDRARLVIAPVGLDAAVQTLTGHAITANAESLDLARRLPLRIREVLRQDGRGTPLETCLDAPATFDVGDKDMSLGADQAAGLTPWTPTAAVKSQGHGAGPLHAAAEGGTLALFLPQEETVSSEQIADWLRFLWRQTDVVRVRLMRRVERYRQMTF